MLEPEDPNASASSEPAAGAKKPARKAAKKAAVRKAAVKKAQPAEAATTGGPTAGDAAPVDQAPVKKATKKAAAKRPAKKTAQTPEVDALTAPSAAERPSEPASGAGPTTAEAAARASREPASAEPASAEPAPAKKASRKRAAKKVPAATAGPDEPTATTDESGTDAAAPGADAAAPAMVAAGVLFRAPAEDAPGPRRRSRKKAAGPAQEPAAGDVDITAAEDVEDAVAEPEDVREAAIEQASGARRRRRRGRRGRGTGARATDAADSAESAEDAEDGETPAAAQEAAEAGEETAEAGTHRRRRRRRAGSDDEQTADEPPNTVTHVRAPKAADDGVKAVKGSTRLEAKRQRRRDGRETTRRRAPIITEAEFLARRESVDRVMAVRQQGDRTQVAVLEDGILVEHYVTRASATSYVGNVYLGRVQNVLPSMEAAFVDISKGRNGVLYAGEVNWDAAGLEGKSRAIENALKSGDTVLAQVTKDPIGHKGARLTSQVSLPGRFLVYVPGGGMTGISRRLPDTERHRLKSILRKIVPEDAGVIVRTAAEGATEEDLTRDVERLKAQWESIEKKAKDTKSAPMLVHGEPDLATRVVRDVFNEDFNALVVQGDEAWTTVSDYIGAVAPDLLERVSKHATNSDLFHDLRVDEQLMKALDRKVWLPSGGSLVIDRTEAMTVIDVNTGKFVGAGGNLEQTVTRNNLEAAEEIVRQLRLRDVGGIVVIDFIDMVLESNRDLVLRRLTECLSRDRTKHQVAEVTSLGLVQMTRKRVGEGLLEAFSETCEVCHGRGVIVHTEPVDKAGGSASGSARQDEERPGGRGKRRRGGRAGASAEPELPPASDEQRQVANAAIAAIHRATALDDEEEVEGDDALADLAGDLVEAAAEATEVAEDIEPLEVVASSPVSAPESDDAADEVERVTVGAEPSPNGVPASVTESPAPTRRRRRVASRPAGPPGAA